MKTKKFFMLLAAVLLSCASAMAQNSPLKGDVNGDGKVDVADIAAVINIMKNGGGTTDGKLYFYVGTEKPTSLSQATIVNSYPTEQTYTNNSGAKSHIFVLTNSDKNVIFEDPNTHGTVSQVTVDTSTIPGYNIYETAIGWANTMSIIIRITEAPVYYWYVGKDESKVGKSGTSYNLDLTQLSTVTSINSIYTNSQSLENIENNVYVVCPTSWVGQFKLVDLNDTDISLSDKTSQITSNVTGYSVLRGNGKIGDSVIKIIRQ